MERWTRLRRWLDSHRIGWLDLIRIYLGCALMAMAVHWVQDSAALTARVQQVPLGVIDSMIGHYIIMAHGVGGLLLAIGMATRIAAGVQIPILLGAVIFVHAREGLFAPTMHLELALLVLFLLVVYTFAGAGRWSIDHLLIRREERAHDAEAAEARATAHEEPIPPLAAHRH